MEAAAVFSREASEWLQTKASPAASRSAACRSIAACTSSPCSRRWRLALSPDRDEPRAPSSSFSCVIFICSNADSMLSGGSKELGEHRVGEVEGLQCLAAARWDGLAECVRVAVVGAALGQQRHVHLAAQQPERHELEHELRRARSVLAQHVALEHGWPSCARASALAASRTRASA